MAPKDKGKNTKDKAAKNPPAAVKKTNKVEPELTVFQKTEANHEWGEKYITVDNKIYSAELRRLQWSW